MAKKNDYTKHSATNYNAHFTRANLFVEMANKTEQGLSNSLFLIATIFLGLTSPLVSDIQQLPEGLKVILFFSWVLTIISILAGLEQIRRNLKFFEERFKLSNEHEATWAEMPSDETTFRNAVTTTDKKEVESAVQTTFIPLATQAITMVVAITLAVIVGGLALFRTNSSCDTTQTVREHHMIEVDSHKGYNTPKIQPREYYEIRRRR